MVKLAPYIDGEQLDTGSQFVRTVRPKDSLGAGMVALGAGLEKVANQVVANDAAVAAKAEELDKRNTLLSTEASFLQFQQAQTQEYQQAADNIDATGKDFSKTQIGNFDKAADAFLQSVPPELQKQYQVKMLHARGQFLHQATSAELSASKTFAQGVITDVSKAMADQISVGVPHETALAQAHETIDGLGLPSNKADELQRRFGVIAESAYTARKIGEDPNGTFQQLQKYVVPSQVSPTAPATAKVVAERAQIQGLDPRIALMTVLRENAQFDPRAKTVTGSSGSFVHGLGQLSKTERQRYGVDGVDDPALQSDALAKLTLANIQNLQRNGLEANPGNIWGGHFLGIGGISTFRKVDPSLNAFEVYDKIAGPGIAAQAFSRNGDMLKKTDTVGDVLKKIDTAAAAAWDKAGSMLAKPGETKPDQGPIEIGGAKMKYLSPQDLAPMLGEAKAAVLKQDDAALKQANQRAVTDGILSPHNEADRKVMDQAAYSLGHTTALMQATGPADPALQQINQLTAQNRYLSKPTAQVAQDLLTNPDVNKKLAGISALSATHAANPVDGLKLSGVSEKNQAIVRDYLNGVVRQNLEPTEALRRAEALNSEDVKKRTDTKEFNDKLKSSLARRTFAEIDADQKITTGGFLGFFKTTDAMPAVDKIKDQMVQRYRQAFEFHMRTGSGDEAAAKDNALADMKRTVNYTFVSGQGKVQPYPPEYTYRAAAPIIGPDGKTKTPDQMNAQERKQAYGYITDQALVAAQSVVKGAVPAGLALVPNHHTAEDVEAHQQPRYDLYYVDPKTKKAVTVQYDFVASPEFGEQRRINEMAYGHPDFGAGAQSETRPAPPLPPARGPAGGANARDAFRAQRK